METIKFAFKVLSLFFELLTIVGLNDRKTLNLICQMFLPVFEDTRVMFAGKHYF